MSTPSKETVFTILSNITDPLSKRTVKDIAQDLVIKDGKVYFSMPCTKKNLEHYAKLKLQIEAEFVKHSMECAISFTNQLKPEKVPVEGVNKILIVASGKGGVGKSVCAFNTAIALANQGVRVGIVDVDIYGPSLPQLSGIKDKPVLDDNKVLPHKKFGISMMSVGYLIDSEDALIWRGPMTSKMLFQLIRQTKWDNLDYLIIDTPPGTGDIHLSLYEQYPIDGVIVVTTPQQMVVADVVRALNMYKKFDIPLIGLVENYSAIVLDDGPESKIFGEGEANKELVSKYGASFFTQIPIYKELNAASDQGKPLPYYSHKSSPAKKFDEIAKNILHYYRK